MKYGLVLEGGAMRGMYTAGVLDILLENNIQFDGMVGVSAGAVFGCNYKSRQIGRSIRYNKKYCRDPRYVSLRSLLLTGDLYNKEFAYHELPTKLDVFDTKTFIENPVEFYAVCTDIDTGKPVYHKLETGDETDIEWMRASASMPLAAKPVHLDGMRLLDGGISDSIPLKWFQSIGYEKNLVILTRPEGYRKNPASRSTRLTASLLKRKYPKTADAMRSRAEVYNETLDYIAAQDENTLVMRPSRTPDVKRIERDPEKLEALYQLGRKDGEAKLEEIRAFLSFAE